MDEDQLERTYESAIENVERYVKSMFGKKRIGWMEEADLLQEARIGVWESLPRWQGGGSLVNWCIQAAEWRLMDRIDGSNLLTRHHTRKLRRFKREVKRLERQGIRNPDLQIDELGISYGEYVQLHDYDRMASVVSLDANNGEGNAPVDNLPDETTLPLRITDVAEELLYDLPEAEQDFIRRHYWNGEGIDSIAEGRGQSLASAYRKHKEILETMKGNFYEKQL